MPVLRGDEVVRMLREKSKFQHTVIVVCSTTVSHQMDIQLKAIGVNYSFTKPIKLDGYVQHLSPILRS